MGIIRGAFKTVKYGIIISALALGSFYAYNHFVPHNFSNQIKSIEAKESYYSEPENLEIIIENNIPYLTDKEKGLKQPIMKDFQLGNASYRLKGLLDEGLEPILSTGKDFVEWLRNRYK